MIAWPVRPEIASSIVMSYQSTVSEKPGIKRGWITAPIVQLLPTSGFRFSFPWLKPDTPDAGVFVHGTTLPSGRVIVVGIPASAQRAARFGFSAITVWLQG